MSIVDSGSSPTHHEIFQRATALRSRIQGWREEIHRRPELGFQEFLTSELIAGVLRDLGIETETGVAKTGVVGTIRGGAGDVVALRADMDALRITEKNGTDFDSTREGLMHACGHDAHTAMLLGVATLLQELAEQGHLPGTVRLLFQPSEEGLCGAMPMIEEGKLDGVNAVFGLHCDPTKRVGTVATRVGPMLPGRAGFRIGVFGEQGSDAVVEAIEKLAVQRQHDPECGFRFRALDGKNRLRIQGRIRYFAEEDLDMLQQDLREACRVIENLGGHFRMDIRLGLPPIVNAPEAFDVATAAITSMLGEGHVIDASRADLGRMTGGPSKTVSYPVDDFAWMAQKAPGCFMFLGVQSPSWGEEKHYLHTPTFRLDPDAYAIGAATLTASARDWMTAHS